MNWARIPRDGMRPRTMRKIAPVRDRLSAAFDPEFFFSAAVSLGGEEIRRRDPLDVYLSAEKFRTLSPNSHFDEIYYRRVHTDVARHVFQGVFLSGLHHYVAYGAAEARMPNPSFETRLRSLSLSLPEASCPQEAEHFIAENEELRDFFRHFPFVDRMAFYNAIGRFLAPMDEAAAFRNFVEETMDTAHYAAVAGLSPSLSRAELVAHYLDTGCREGLSPRPDFDEAFYVAFYDDVRRAVEDAGPLRCGYEHWFIAGRREERLPRHDLKAALEARFSGITEPVAIARVDELADALTPIPVRQVERRSRRLHILVPDLNPDIFFGGYMSLMELMKYLRRRGIDLSIVKTSRDDDGLEYFLYHLDDPQVRALFEDVPGTGRKSGIEVGPNDRFLAYSGWDALRAQHLLRYTNAGRFTYLIQEYEPIFIEHNSTRFLLASAYATQHFPVFNSSPLKAYFANNRLGVFANGAEHEDHAVFEHVLTPPACAPNLDPSPAGTRTFFVYARPEAHAGRNLFEVAVLALRAALRRVTLRHRWEFVGAGALSELPDVPLTGDMRLTLLPRMPRDEYAALLARSYAGLSLMYAPHPSVVPFELARTGALVVTNTFANRDAAFFGAIGDNIFPAELTLEDITERVAEVLRRADALDAKPSVTLRGPWPDTWDEACSAVVSELEKHDLL